MPATTSVKEPIGINGLGRIGKLSLWHHAARGFFPGIVVNSGRVIGKGLEAVCNVIEKDSTYGTIHRFLHGVNASPCVHIVDRDKNLLEVNGVPVTILQKARNPMDIDWRSHGVRVVVDATGAFNDPTVPENDPKGSLRGHLAAGAEKVLNSAAFKIKDKTLKTPPDAATFIYGINHDIYNPTRHHVISAASCTTTALAHMLKPLFNHFHADKLLTASMSTIHAATNTQSVLDSVPKAGDKDLRKNRSALNSIILTSTNAAKALEEVIPQIRQVGFLADSVRIPLQTESLIILNITIQSEIDLNGDCNVTHDALNDYYREAAGGAQKGLLICSESQNVPSDLSGAKAAVVIEAVETHTRTAFVKLDLGLVKDLGISRTVEIPVTHAKIFGWYDNEYGSYTNLLGDLTVHVRKGLD
jgi:glyceraldehyde 3-phosphate dehydrogenase